MESSPANNTPGEQPQQEAQAPPPLPPLPPARRATITLPPLRPAPSTSPQLPMVPPNTLAPLRPGSPPPSRRNWHPVLLHMPRQLPPVLCPPLPATLQIIDDPPPGQGMWPSAIQVRFQGGLLAHGALVRRNRSAAGDPSPRLDWSIHAEMDETWRTPEFRRMNPVFRFRYILCATYFACAWLDVTLENNPARAWLLRIGRELVAQGHTVVRQLDTTGFFQEVSTWYLLQVHLEEEERE